MEIKGRFDHFNINVTNLEKVSNSTKRRSDCMSLTARKRPMALSSWCTLPTDARVSHWN